jgi:hypothetical protein
VRLLKYKGKDTAAIDPYWDFEHEVGEGYDINALRLWRTRVFLSGSQIARVQLRLQCQRDSGGAEQDMIDLPPAKHILRFTGGADLSPESYAPVSSTEITGSPPMLVLAVNLTGLHPGAYVFTTDVVNSDQEEKEMRFRVKRQPFYTLHDPASGMAPPTRQPVRSSTGLKELEEEGKTHLLTAHTWKVYRNMWTPDSPPSTGYTRVDALNVLAITLFQPDCRPKQTRWKAVESVTEPLRQWSRSKFASWRAPGEHAKLTDGGFGLSFPALHGLPKQPDEDGEYIGSRGNTGGKAHER